MAVLRALNSCTTKYNEVQPLYNQNTLNQIERKALNAEERNGAEVRSHKHNAPRTAPQADLKSSSLGIITKSHPILATQGFQRIQDYALQQQAAKLLHGKSRVCFVVNVKLIS